MEELLVIVIVIAVVIAIYAVTRLVMLRAILGGLGKREEE
jgi:hypothetical protein